MLVSGGSVGSPTLLAKSGVPSCLLLSHAQEATPIGGPIKVATVTDDLSGAHILLLEPSEILTPAEPIATSTRLCIEGVP